MTRVGILMVNDASLTHQGHRVATLKAMVLTLLVLVLRKFFARVRHLLLTWAATTNLAYCGDITGCFVENHPLGRGQGLARGPFGGQSKFNVLACGRGVPVIASSEHVSVAVGASLDALTWVGMCE
jgi:hypothetical protein